MFLKTNITPIEKQIKEQQKLLTQELVYQALYLKSSDIKEIQYKTQRPQLTNHGVQ